MNNNLTDITLVLDRSGSMAAIASDTIGGVNKFLVDQQQAPGSATITIHQFDDVFETVIDAKEIKSADQLTTKTFVPRGSTALLDAMGRAIVSTGTRLDSAPEKDRAGKVIFVVVTDGLENASHEYSREKIFEMVKHQREKYSWEFVFLAANQDAISVGTSYGFAAQNTMTYAASPQGVQCSYDSFSHNTTQFRSGAVGSLAFTAKDKDAQKKAGAK